MAGAAQASQGNGAYFAHRQAGKKVWNNSGSIFTSLLAGILQCLVARRHTNGAGLGGGAGNNAALSGLEVPGERQPEGKAGFL